MTAVFFEVRIPGMGRALRITRNILPVLSLLAMMGLAFLMSLCSESDAFVAASFTSFGPAAQLAFLVSGPMIDLKLAALYAGTYSKGFVRTVIVAVVAVTLVGTLWIQVVFG